MQKKKTSIKKYPVAAEQDGKLDYIQFIVIDLFCGAGGTTLGFQMADSGWEQFSRFLKANGIDHPKEKESFFKMAEVVACVNHDPMAIISHHINNKKVKHFEEDITKLYGFMDHGVLFKTPQFMKMLRLIEMYRAFYPHAKIILWGSLECTNFSRAKGGMSRDADSRTLANHLFPYIIYLDPDYIQIENVVEFKDWGPLIVKVMKTEQGHEYCPIVLVKPEEKKKKKNKKKPSTVAQSFHPDPDLVPPKKEEELQADYFAPIWIPDPATKGIWWMKWRDAVNSIGYYDDWRQINVADHGAYTSRNRLFGCFAKHGLPMAWPVPTHDKKPEKSSKSLKKWEAVKHVLDFTDEGKSIFNRKKRISPKSFQRMFMGCVRHIAGGKKNFISRYNGGKPESRNNSTDEPASVITTNNRLALVNADFLMRYNSGDPITHVPSVENPSPALLTNTLSKVKAVFLSKAFSGNPDDKNISVEEPSGSITTKDHHQIISAFIDQRNGGDPTTKSRSIDEPSKTITRTGGNQQIVQAHFIHKYYSSGGQHNSVEEPAATLTTKARLAKVSANIIDDNKKAIFLSTYNSNKPQSRGGGNEGRSLDHPAPTITTGHTPTLVQAEKFILNNRFQNNGSSIEGPNPTLTTGTNHFIINPSWEQSNAEEIEAPYHVVLVRPDEEPLYLIVSLDGGPVVIPVYKDECEWTVKIKEFMVLYDICDIRMRMLAERELLPIMGFPKDYFEKVRKSGIKLTGTDAKKFIGNAVHPLVPKNMCEALNVELFLSTVSEKNNPRRMAA